MSTIFSTFFRLFHFHIPYNNSILGRRDSTFNIPAYNSFFRSFLGFSTTTSSFARQRSQPKWNVRLEKEDTWLPKTWLFHNQTRRFSLRTLIGLKNGRGKNGGRKGELANLPYCHTFRFQVMPSLVHLVQSSLQHNSVILARQRAQQLPACAVQRRVHVSVRLDFRLEVL